MAIEKIIYTQEALNDISFWKISGNDKIRKRITKLLQSIQQTPFEGIGKPEPLKYNHAGKWSRRITQKDRLIYEVSDKEIIVYALRGHYE